MDELFQTYTFAGEPLELVPRPIVHAEGIWHKSSNVLVFRPNGDLLLQKRASTKDTFPDTWDLSVAEHLKPEESFHDSAIRGLKEELSLDGVDVVSIGEPMRYSFESQDENIKDNEFQQCFYCITDKDVVLNEGELSAIRFCTLDELENEMEGKPENFTPWFIQAAKHIDLFNIKIDKS